MKDKIKPQNVTPAVAAKTLSQTTPNRSSSECVSSFSARIRWQPNPRRDGRRAKPRLIARVAKSRHGEKKIWRIKIMEFKTSKLKRVIILNSNRSLKAANGSKNQNINNNSSSSNMTNSSSKTSNFSTSVLVNLTNLSATVAKDTIILSTRSPHPLTKTR